MADRNSIRTASFLCFRKASDLLQLTLRHSLVLCVLRLLTTLVNIVLLYHTPYYSQPETETITRHSSAASTTSAPTTPSVGSCVVVVAFTSKLGCYYKSYNLLLVHPSLGNGPKHLERYLDSKNYLAKGLTTGYRRDIVKNTKAKRVSRY